MTERPTSEAEPRGVALRRGTPDDTEACHGVMRHAITDLARRHGMPMDGATEDWWQSSGPQFDSLSRAAAEWWVAADESNGSVVGYARSIERGGLLELTEFFVHPARQWSRAVRTRSGGGERKRSDDQRGPHADVPNEGVMEETMALPQGDTRLLESDVARTLLASTVPARFAYVASDGTPRVLPTWFHWTGEELVMPTFIAAPHVRRPAARLRALRTRPDVAITIDTEGFPPGVLLVRGRATVAEVDGIPPEYALAARRYMGEEAAAGYLAQIDRPGTRMARIAVRPAWVGVLDFQTRLPGGMGDASG